MPRIPDTAAEAADWQKTQRMARGWSTTHLANLARAIARREGSTFKLTQQSISGFEQPGSTQRVPEWLRFVAMAFEEGDAPQQQDTEPRDDLAYVREVDVRYAMGDGSAIEDYPSTRLIPFNLSFIRSLSPAPLARLFLATGFGESMEPTILRDDLLMIDTNETRVTRGDLIWALEYAGAGYVKRLRMVKVEGRQRVRILSDNPSVPPEDADPEDIHIVGKVVWIGRSMGR